MLLSTPVTRAAGRSTLMLVVLSLLCALAPGVAASLADAAGSGLLERSLKKREAAVRAIAATDDPRRLEVLQGLLDSRVYYRRSDRQLVFADRDGTDFAITALADGAPLGTAARRDVRKVAINNSIRRFIRAELARASLNSDDPAARLAAIDSLSGTLDESTIALLRERLVSERDTNVRDRLLTTLALVDIGADEAATRSAAITLLGESNSQNALNELRKLVASPPPNLDSATRAQARRALSAFELRVSFYEWLETLFFGLSLGSVLALAAVGLAITFGVMGVINMAHGELMMLGAYTTWLVQQMMPNHIGWSLAVAVPAAFLVAGLFGILIERGVIRFLYGRPLETLLATFGVSLILQQMVRTVFTPLNRAVETPAWMSGVWEVNALLSFTVNRVTIVVFTLVVFLLLMLVMKYTALGLQVRAVAQNRRMARALGVRSGRVDTMTFALGSGIAGIAGVALSQLTNVGPNLGQSYIVDSFLVVVFGGVGNLWGTLVSGLTLGVANKFMEPWAGAVLAKVLVLVFIIVFIQRRPRGLFPQKGRAAAD